jgi:phosphate transport system protein
LDVYNGKQKFILGSSALVYIHPYGNPIKNNSASAESTPFQRKIRGLEQDVLRMGALVEKSCRLSHEAMFGRNLAALQGIDATDREIDKFYRQIDVESAQLMAIASPAAKDLRILNAFIQMVRDLERVGDYAEDLGELAVKLFPYPVHDCMPELEKMSNTARTMLAKSLISIAQLDGDARHVVESMDDGVDASYELIYEHIASQHNFQGSLEPIMLITLSMRCLERMADHANNVARRVNYIVTGQH